MVSLVSPDPDVRVVLERLVGEVQSILREEFIGFYLYGSLTYEAFDRHSDVDFVVVTQTELSEALFSSLRAMHADIAKMDCWCATQLEGSYIPRPALLRYEPSRALYFHIDRGVDEPLKRMQHDDPILQLGWWGGWVILRSNLYEHGIALAGPAPQTLIEPVRPEELHQAALADLQGWAQPLLLDPSKIYSRAYQSYIVLTLCRILYTLEFGALVSKPAAARWAETELEEPWAALIQQAWLDRQADLAGMPPSSMESTLDFIRYTIEKSQSNVQDETPPTR